VRTGLDIGDRVRQWIDSVQISALFTLLYGRDIDLSASHLPLCDRLAEGDDTSLQSCTVTLVDEPLIRVLLVDDDDEIRSAVAGYLARYGMRVESAPDGRAMRRAVAHQGVDIVVLDLMLPDESGLDLCRWLRRDGHAVPVIMLTALGDAPARIVGLELGADDYLGKPFEPRELVARIRALLRRAGGRRKAEPSGGGTVVFNGWQFDPTLRRLVSRNGVVVALSNAEFRLLQVFVGQPRKLLTRDSLVALTRAPGADASDQSLNLAISRLRGKLGDSMPASALIRTVRGEGYLFDADVAR
jgi:two-component system OmpR family response regulator